MTKIELKEKLLATKLFNDNEWLDKYVDLIDSYKLDKHIKYESAKHHILPKHYFIFNNLEIDDSKENICELKHVNHAKAHLYLALASNNDYLYMANSYSMWLCIQVTEKRKLPNLDELDEFLKYLDTLDIKYIFSEETKEKHRKLKWFNNGKIEIQLYAEDIIPEGFQKGRIKSNLKGVNNNYIWINNGIEQTRIKKDLLDNYPGWNFGMLDRGEEWRKHLSEKEISLESRKKNSESKKKFFKENPDFRNDGMFKKGQQAHNSNKISITNGINNHYINLDDLTEWESKGWYKGNTQKHKQRKSKSQEI